MGLITKSELKYILSASLFGFIYFLYLLPLLLSIGIENSSSLIQFLFFVVGLYFIYFFILKGISLGTKQSIGGAFVGIIPFLVFDLWMPEYHINLINGTLIKGATLGTYSSDYFLGGLAHSIGINGYFTVIFSYLIVPIILLIGYTLIRKNFVKEV